MSKKTKVYVASTLSNWKMARKAIEELAAADIEVTYDWTVWGEKIYGEETTVPSGTTFSSPEKLREIGENEVEGVFDAGVVLAIMPGERGAHFEMAIGWMLRKPLVICTGTDTADRPTSFHYLPRFERFESLIPAVTRTVELVNAMECLRTYKAWHPPFCDVIA